MKKSIITITGLPGSGKSSTAKGVAAELGYEHFSSGDLFRSMAAERGLTVEEINFLAETQKEIDHEVDKELVKIGHEKEKLVIDTRIGFHWIPDSFKVFLDLDPKIGAERTLIQIQTEGRVSQAATSFAEMYQNTLKRIESEKKRYANLYNLDFTDKKHYDLIVDTGKNVLREVIDIIVRDYHKWLDQV